MLGHIIIMTGSLIQYNKKTDSCFLKTVALSSYSNCLHFTVHLSRGKALLRSLWLQL